MVCVLRCHGHKGGGFAEMSERDRDAEVSQTRRYTELPEQTGATRKKTHCRRASLGYCTAQELPLHEGRPSGTVLDIQEQRERVRIVLLVSIGYMCGQHCSYQYTCEEGHCSQENAPNQD